MPGETDDRTAHGNRVSGKEQTVRRLEAYDIVREDEFIDDDRPGSHCRARIAWCGERDFQAVPSVAASCRKEKVSGDRTIFIGDKVRRSGLLTLCILETHTDRTPLPYNT